MTDVYEITAIKRLIHHVNDNNIVIACDEVNLPQTKIKWFADVLILRLPV